jgi:DNA-binding response OmpR family regulator
MRVLVVHEQRAAREELTKALQQKDHVVEPFADSKGALAAFSRERAHVVVLSAPGPLASEFAKKLRMAQGAEYAYLLVLLDRTMPGEVTMLFAAGVDDFLRRPISHEELVARVEAPIRLRRVAPMLLRSTSVDFMEATPFASRRSYAEAGTILASSLSEMLGILTLTEKKGLAGETAGRIGATIPMNLPNEGLELRITIVADNPALPTIATLLFGTSDGIEDATMRDSMRELANTAAGVLKRSLLEEQLVVAMGLPADCTKPPLAGPGTRWWVAGLPEGAGSLLLCCELIERRNQRVPAAALREGMVVVTDLRSSAGGLLIAGGTRITSTSAERIGRALGDRFLVEVACAS